MVTESYASISEGTDILVRRLNTDAWDDADADDITKALAQSTDIIDRLNFLGDKASETQELQFPRGTDSEIPNDVKIACVLIAMALLDGVDPDMEAENLRMVAQGYGNIRSTYDALSPSEHILAGVPSVEAWRYLKPYLRDPRELKLNRVS